MSSKILLWFSSSTPTLQIVDGSDRERSTSPTLPLNDSEDRLNVDSDTEPGYN